MASLERKLQMARKSGAKFIEQMLARPDVAGLYTFDNVVYVNMDTKVLITCVFHKHDFSMAPAEFQRYRSKCDWCNLRMKRRISDGYGVIKHGQFMPQRWVVESVWRNTIDYADYEYRGPIVLVYLKCLVHAEPIAFAQSAAEHHKGYIGCPECLKTQPANHWTKLRNAYPDLYALMNVPNPNQTHYVSSEHGNMLEWKCPIDPTHIYQRELFYMLHVDKMCWTCRDAMRLVDFAPHLVKEWDTDKNKGIDVNTIVVGDQTVYYWKCIRYDGVSHEFEHSVYDRVAHKRNCYRCNGATLSDTNRLSIIYPNIAEEWDASNPLKASDVMYGTKSAAVWKCKSGHVWTTVIAYRTLGKSGCPKCSRRGFSIQCIEWLNYVEKRDTITIQHAGNSENEFQIPGTSYKADGYCADTKTIYEFHGDYWHGNPDKFAADVVRAKGGLTFGVLYARTVVREKLIRNLGFNLVVIWQNKFEQLKRSKFTIPKQLIETCYLANKAPVSNRMVQKAFADDEVAVEMLDKANATLDKKSSVAIVKAPRKSRAKTTIPKAPTTEEVSSFMADALKASDKSE